eukprot:gene6660-7359_t
MKYKIKDSPTERGGDIVKKDLLIAEGEAALTDVAGCGLSKEAMVQQQQAVLQSQVQSKKSRYLCIDGSYESFPNAFKIGFAMKGAGNLRSCTRFYNSEYAICFLYCLYLALSSNQFAVFIDHYQTDKAIQAFHSSALQSPSQSYRIILIVLKILQRCCKVCMHAQSRADRLWWVIFLGSRIWARSARGDLFSDIVMSK